MFLIKFMFKTVFAIVLVVLAVGAYGIYSARALPEWFDESKANTDFADEAIKKELGNGGVDLLARKSVDILRGRVSLDSDEFNALLMASLKADEDGRKLLEVSDGVRAFLRQGEIEISAVINLNKFGEISLSNDTLRSLKVPVERANQSEMAVKYLSLKSVSVVPGKIDFKVQPRL